jgi:DNA excision repair protein ERCC-3
MEQNQYTPENPLIVQSDMTMLLEVSSPLYEEVRDAVAPFAEIIKSPEHVHTYCITPISLWNAASAGLTSEEVIKRLTHFSRFGVSHNLIVEIQDIMGRYGRVKIEEHDDDTLKLTTSDPLILDQLIYTKDVSIYIKERLNNTTALIASIHRGLLKQALIKNSYPAVDLAGYRQGEPLELTLKENNGFIMRPYQVMARDAFFKGGSLLGGNGVVVLPCGAGKTIVGMSVMALIQSHTLILTTGVTAIRQWKRELCEKTTLRKEDIGEYSGEVKEIRSVTLTTYQILTYRKKRDADFIHFKSLNDHPWGLIIYDEVHLLPAQVFRFSASLQSVRRLGLTATLIREDGREGDVFSLIGPKCFDVPWKVIEKQGWIAEAECFEIRVGIEGDTRLEYVKANKRQRFRIASENPAKIPIIQTLLSVHKSESILVIGQYIDQMKEIARKCDAPLIIGQTSQKKRDELYKKFRNGEIKVMIVSSVANFAIDLPDASVAVQVSGKFGSRQEEAQRLGRILRPKADGRSARFYSLITRDTEEQDFALKRQLFLTEQGYSYNIINDHEIEQLCKF